MASKAQSSRRRRERQRHRQEILSAALELFAQNGFHNVSMHDIAAAAEFGTGTLYNFFSSKEDLFFELLVACAEESLAVILPALQGPGDEREKVARFIAAHERIAVEQAVAIRLYLLENRGRYLRGPKVEAKKREMDERLTSRLSDVIAAGIRKGLFNDIDAVIAAKCLCGTLESMVLADAQARDLRADLEKVKAVFFRGLLRSSGDRDDG
ncbi:MAG: helix-turn-helix transcriptional regulator [Sedimentisphaerales bacterium]|nr:helix-turn-helix transcriptional regulator [Sedimentisphaerales bacterium]